MKILHTADLHLREVGDARWEALMEILRLARREKVDFLAISGDLFDDPDRAEGLRVPLREMLSAQPFRVVLIPGNHDRDVFEAQKGFYFGENVRVIQNLENPVNAGSVWIWGFPFEDLGREKILEQLWNIRPRMNPEKRHLLLFHGELLDAMIRREDMGEEGGRAYMPVRLSFFKPLPFQYVLAGHFHTQYYAWEFSPERYFIYPGSPVSITRKETGRRKVNLVEVGKPPRWIELDTFHYETVTLRLDPGKTASPVDLLREQLQNLHPRAHLLLRVEGYFHRKLLNRTEEELARELDRFVEKTLGDRVAEKVYAFRDIHAVLDSALFQEFLRRLDAREIPEDEKQAIRELVIQAFAETS